MVNGRKLPAHTSSLPFCRTFTFSLTPSLTPAVAYTTAATPTAIPALAHRNRPSQSGDHFHWHPTGLHTLTPPISPRAPHTLPPATDLPICNSHKKHWTPAVRQGNLPAFIGCPLLTNSPHSDSASDVPLASAKPGHNQAATAQCTGCDRLVLRVGRVGGTQCRADF